MCRVLLEFSLGTINRRPIDIIQVIGVLVLMIRLFPPDGNRFPLDFRHGYRVTQSKTAALCTDCTRRVPVSKPLPFEHSDRMRLGSFTLSGQFGRWISHCRLRIPGAWLPSEFDSHQSSDDEHSLT